MSEAIKNETTEMAVASGCAVGKTECVQCILAGFE